MSPSIYEPREDSFLLLRNITPYANGRILDMGTGSGILAEEAAKYAEKVIAVDINPDAVEYCKKKYNGIDFRTSDLFSKVNGKFNLIIFNPPYLPDDKRAKDVALDGGKRGYEVIERFLNQSNKHLKPGGRILLLFSSLSKPRRIVQIIRKNRLEFRQIDGQKLDFEELYVYLLQKEISNIEYFAKGKRGFVYTGILDGRKVIIKKENPRSRAVNRISHEADMLRLLNRHDIGPELIRSDTEQIVMEFVEGDLILEFIDKYDKTTILKVLKEIFTQMRTLDELGYNKEEMHHPVKHIIVNKKPILIDFERTKKTINPKNVTQFCQFLINISPLLRKKGIIIDKASMIESARRYKVENSGLKGILNELR